MGKKKLWITFTALFMTIAMMLAGCGGKGGEGAEGGKASDKVTVTFYDSDGTTVLKEEQVDSGGTAASYEPEKEGYDFMGWFGTPQMQHPFDFTQPLTADTSIFGGFVQLQEDTREFAIVGNGTSPLMLSSNWGKTINEEHKMTKESGSNTYTITLDLYEGDEFQFAINTSWHNQRGYGYLDTISQDGTEYFVNSGGLGDTSVKRSNIKVAVTGNYTFTLTTYPADDTYETDNANYTEENKEGFNISPYDKITWTYNGEAQEAAGEMQVNYYIKGAGITNWQDVYTSRTGFTAEGDVHTLTVALREGEEFLMTSTITVNGETSTGTEYVRFSNLDEEGAALFDKTDSYNMVAKADGLYTFTYHAADGVLSAVCDPEQFLPEYEYYAKGSFGGTEWGTEGNADYQLVETEKGSFVYVLEALAVEAGDEIGVQSMLDGERMEFINFTSMAAASDTNANGDFEAHSNGYNNIVAKESGTYAVTYDAYTGSLTFTK